MNKKGQIGLLGGVLMTFIMLIIGFALLTPVANTNQALTVKPTTNNQTVSTTGAYISDAVVNTSINFTIYANSVWKQNECPLTSVGIQNFTGTVLTANTDYILYAPQGVFSLLNTTKTGTVGLGNRSLVNYTFCQDGYITEPAGRSMSGLIQTLMILVLLIMVAGVGYKLFNNKK